MEFESVTKQNGIIRQDHHRAAFNKCLFERKREEFFLGFDIKGSDRTGLIQGKQNRIILADIDLLDRGSHGILAVGNHRGKLREPRLIGIDRVRQRADRLGHQRPVIFLGWKSGQCQLRRANTVVTFGQQFGRGIR